MRLLTQRWSPQQISRHHAIRLAREGADIIGIDICAPVPNVLYRASTQDQLNETVATVDSLGRRMIATVLDVRDLGSMTQFFSRSVTELGGSMSWWPTPRSAYGEDGTT